MTEARPDPDPSDWLNPTPAYDVIASRYAAKFSDELSRKPFDRDLLDRFAAAVRDHSSAAVPVCDLGCGPGHIGGYVAQRGATVMGIDLSEGMVRPVGRFRIWCSSRAT
jgi:2-polyprenyl-3-methyl-5-hydroxy-6-metoxy-1,4-benzoquinol methylase